MSSVGIKELKQDASRILRRVREHGESFDVTYHGKVVARLVPAEGPVESRDEAMTIDEFFEVWDELTAEDPSLPVGNYALDAIRESRGRLE
ncbi:MAG: type II toxin-antitoxin system prevent-host-death family antitoxin [Thermomicrobiales bacterium]